ncbi:MAG: hypothetical protein ABR540_00930 [Acidimicrobiales bacterium]
MPLPQPAIEGGHHRLGGGQGRSLSLEGDVDQLGRDVARSPHLQTEGLELGGGAGADRVGADAGPRRRR